MVDFFFARFRPNSRGSRELSRSPGRPGEGQGGPNKGALDPKNGQHSRTKNFSDWSAAQVCSRDFKYRFALSLVRVKPGTERRQVSGRVLPRAHEKISSYGGLDYHHIRVWERKQWYRKTKTFNLKESANQGRVMNQCRNNEKDSKNDRFILCQIESDE